MPSAIPLPITALYLAIFAVFAGYLAFLPGKMRGTAGISVGDGGRPDLLVAMQNTARTNGHPICYDPHSYPYWFNDTNDNGQCDPGEAIFPNRYTDWTAELIKAGHNYQQSQAEPGAWAHNFAYATQLVIDSFRELGGDPAKHVRPPTSGG